MVVVFFLFESESNQSLRRLRVFRDHLNPLDAYSDLDYIYPYRVDRGILIELIERLDTCMSRATWRSYAISTTTQLAASLQFLATDSFHTVVASCHVFRYFPAFTLKMHR